MKRILCIILTLSIVLAVSFQCTITSSAIAVADDVIIAACIGLSVVSAGVAFASWSDFFTGDQWKGACYEIGHDMDIGFDILVNDFNVWSDRAGQWFFEIGDKAWNATTGWLKKIFNGQGDSVTVEYEEEVPTHPTSITLDNGVVVPWAEWMERPFFIYQLPSNNTIFAWYCTGTNPGCNILNQRIRVWCTGTGKTYRYTLQNGVWADPVEHNMNYGLTYKGTTGSFYDLNFGSQVLNGNIVSQIMQYRTMDLVIDDGTPQEQSPPNTIPEVEEPVVQQITLNKIDENKFPGAVDAPITNIAEGESILIKVPSELIEGLDTSNPSITTDKALAAHTIAEMNPSDVKPKVKTNTVVGTGTIDQIITDTADPSLPGQTNSIETANKFKLPKSFLEGFPFSIPYSIYAGLVSFVAEPQAPYFNFDFKIPKIGLNENIDIDLSKFNPVAQICRALLSVVWLAGLALACNKFIKR